jgi:hypothetical protein
MQSAKFEVFETVEIEVAANWYVAGYQHSEDLAASILKMEAVRSSETLVSYRNH